MSLMDEIGRGGRGGGRGGGRHGGHRHGHGRGRRFRGGPGFWGPGPWFDDYGPIIIDETEDEEEKPKVLKVIHHVAGSPPDLPELWGDALQVSVQQRCTGSGLGKKIVPFSHVVKIENKPATTLLVIHDTIFRGSQAVEAFVKKTDSGCIVLVQPKAMRPSSVARCVSLYRVTVPVPSTCLPITRVILRGDRYGSKTPPIEEVRMT